MKCMILAAGYATRLYPLTENFPKPLLRVGEKSILDWLIGDLDAAGVIDEYIVISNHKYADHFRSWAAEKPQRIRIVDDGTESNETRLGAVRDLLLAVESLQIEDDLLVIAGDNLLDFSLQRFLTYIRQKNAACIMRYREEKRERLVKCGVVEIDADDRVLSMEEKPAEPKSHWCCPPFYYYPRRDAALLRQALEEGCGADAPGSFAAWLSGRSAVYAMEMPGSRYDIGNLESYERVKKEYRGIC